MIILLLTISIVFISKNKSVNATLDEVRLKEVEKNNMFAIMVKGNNGEYAPSEVFPGKGYKLNDSKSGCMDVNGEKIENSLEYDSDSNKITVSTNKTSRCYLYFDKKQSLVDDLRKYDTNNTLSDILVWGNV